MPACNPAPQCKLIRYSGNRCGSPALRGKPFCYHHDGDHRSRARERILGEKLDRLGDRLDAMDTSELLGFLHKKLETLQKTFNRFPEVRYTLVHTLDRIEEITSLESALSQYVSQYQQFARHQNATPSQLNNLPATSPQSII